MGNPKVQVKLSDSNLGILPADASGVFGLIVALPAANTSGYGIPVVIKSKAAAKTELADPLNAAFLAVLVNGFFGEVLEGAPLYCLFLTNTTSLSAMADIENNHVSALYNFSNKTIRAIGIARYPDNTYVPTITDGFDADVHAAVTKAQQQATAAIQAYKPIEFLIQGFGAALVATAKDYSSTQNDNVHIVVGAENDDTVISILRALGRKASSRPSRNVGRIQSGSLAIIDGTVLKVGSSLLSALDTTDLDSWHDKGYMTYVVNENQPGYVFNDDISLTDPTRDYSTWANNATIGEAMRISYSIYYKTLKDDVDVDAATGRIGVAVEKNLEQTILDAINKQLGSSVSGVDVLVNPDIAKYAALYNSANIDNPNLNLTSGGMIYIFLTIVPKGYIKNVTVALGFGLA